MQRVVITGLGTVNPIGNSVDEFWEGLSNGRNGINTIQKFDASRLKTRFAGEITGLDMHLRFPQKEMRRLDDFSLYALLAADEAIMQSKIDLPTIDPYRCGVIWGSSLGGIQSFQEEMIQYNASQGVPCFSPFLIPKLLPDIAAGVIAIKYQFMGVNFAASSACASSTHALISAYQNIQLGKADLVVAGGSEAAICIAGIGGFNAFKGLSLRNEDPQGACRPFDKRRDGFVVGEGAGALVLERLDHALARKALIWAEITGTGMTCDAYHITASHPLGSGAYAALKGALLESGLGIGDLDYINAHATSTLLGDSSEMNAIHRLVQEAGGPPKFWISSTKSMTGHLIGAAGAVEMIASVLAMHHGLVPHTINTSEIDPELPLGEHILIGRPAKADVTHIANLNFGFGGHNAAIVATRYHPQ